MATQDFNQLFTWKLQKSLRLPALLMQSCQKSHAPSWNARWEDGADIWAGPALHLETE